MKGLGLHIALVALASIFGCSDRKAVYPESQVEVRTDSVLSWIERGNDPGLEEEKRTTYLKMALHAAETETNDSLKGRYYSKLSLAFLRLSDSLAFKKTNAIALDLASRQQDTVALAEAHWDLADFYNIQSRPDSAFYHYSEANSLYDELGDNFMSGRMLYNMAVIQGEVKDYTGSEINTVKAIELFKPLQKDLQLYLCYNNLGSITKELEEFDRALDYYKSAREYLDRLPGEHNFLHSLQNNIGVVYQEMGEHRKAIPYFEGVVHDTLLARQRPRLYARALNNMAYSQHQLNSEEDLKDQFRTAVRILDSIEDWQGVARAHFNGAEYYRDRQDTAHALAHANLAMQYALRSKNNKRLLETMELLVNLDPDNAVAHTRAYIKLDDSLQREERAIRNKFARIRFETDEFIAQNELLARQRQLWIGVAFGIFLLAFSGIVIVIQRIRNQRLRFQQQQQESNLEIFNLMLAQNQKLEEGKQSEQKRISEELHDGILGEMNGVRMVLLGLNKKMDDAAVALRAQAISKLQEIQEEIRSISHELSDASYRKFHNFVLSLQDLIRSIGDAAGIRYEFTYDEDIDWDLLKGEAKINLYRIVQECLQNAVKHSEAEMISLNLHGSSSNIVITVSDNGRGFQTQSGKKGIGHKNISSRVKKLSGTWEVKSSPGKGTTVIVRLPYPEGNPNNAQPISRKENLQEV